MNRQFASAVLEQQFVNLSPRRRLRALPGQLEC
jgi:hypothetical protein